MDVENDHPRCVRDFKVVKCDSAVGMNALRMEDVEWVGRIQRKAMMCTSEPNFF